MSSKNSVWTLQTAYTFKPRRAFGKRVRCHIRNTSRTGTLAGGAACDQFPLHGRKVLANASVHKVRLEYGAEKAEFVFEPPLAARPFPGFPGLRFAGEHAVLPIVRWGGEKKKEISKEHTAAEGGRARPLVDGEKTPVLLPGGGEEQGGDGGEHKKETDGREPGRKSTEEISFPSRVDTRFKGAGLWLPAAADMIFVNAADAGGIVKH